MIRRSRVIVRNKLLLSSFTSPPPSPPSFCCCVNSSGWLGANAFKSHPPPPRSAPRAWTESRRSPSQLLGGLGKERTTPAMLTPVRYKWTSLVGSQIPYSYWEESRSLWPSLTMITSLFACFSFYQSLWLRLPIRKSLKLVSLHFEAGCKWSCYCF